MFDRKYNCLKICEHCKKSEKIWGIGITFWNVPAIHRIGEGTTAKFLVASVLITLIVITKTIFTIELQKKKKKKKKTNCEFETLATRWPSTFICINVFAQRNLSS